MASNRLLVWIASCFKQLFGEDGVCHTSTASLPTKSGSLWDRATCEKWLKDRGLHDEDRSIMRVRQLREGICTCIADNPNIPVLSHLKGATLNDIENMLVSHCAFTSRALDHTNCRTATIELENYVKLYLSYVLEFNNKHGFNSTKNSMIYDI